MDTMQRYANEGADIMSYYACTCEVDHDTTPSSQWCDACQQHERENAWRVEPITYHHDACVRGLSATPTLLAKRHPRLATAEPRIYNEGANNR